jgi:hypothetical protein
MQIDLYLKSLDFSQMEFTRLQEEKQTAPPKDEAAQ